MRAKDFFNDNFRRLGPQSAQADPTAHNLYRGLYALAEDVQDILDRQMRIEKAIKDMRDNSLK